MFENQFHFCSLGLHRWQNGSLVNLSQSCLEDCLALTEHQILLRQLHGLDLVTLKHLSRLVQCFLKLDTLRDEVVFLFLGNHVLLFQEATLTTHLIYPICK